MVELVRYTPEHREATVTRIIDFFSFHRGLMTGEETLVEDSGIHAAQALTDWQGETDTLYVILFYGNSVGFLHIRARGPEVVWIEDIYVDKIFRGRGIASQAIVQAENMAREKGFEAISIDVVPRNGDAVRLYHRLGYTSLALVTVRKELKEETKEKRDQRLDLLGYEFKY